MPDWLWWAFFYALHVLFRCSAPGFIVCLVSVVFLWPLLLLLLTLMWVCVSKTWPLSIPMLTYFPALFLNKSLGAELSFPPCVFRLQIRTCVGGCKNTARGNWILGTWLWMKESACVDLSEWLSGSACVWNIYKVGTDDTHTRIWWSETLGRLPDSCVFSPEKADFSFRKTKEMKMKQIRGGRHFFVWFKTLTIINYLIRSCIFMCFMLVCSSV